MTIENTAQETPAQRLKKQIRSGLPVVAPEEQLADVKALAAALAGDRLHAEGRQGACKLVDSSGEEARVPEVLVFMLELAAEVLARGDAISMDPFRRKLTTRQVADILLVPTEYVVRLLDEGRIPYTGTGEHRRMRIEDVLEFREKWDQEREEGLNDLIRMTEELGGYEKQSKLFENQKRPVEVRAVNTGETDMDIEDQKGDAR